MKEPAAQRCANSAELASWCWPGCVIHDQENLALLVAPAGCAWRRFAPYEFAEDRALVFAELKNRKIFSTFCEELRIFLCVSIVKRAASDSAVLERAHKNFWAEEQAQRTGWLRVVYKLWNKLWGKTDTTAPPWKCVRSTRPSPHNPGWVKYVISRLEEKHQTILVKHFYEHVSVPEIGRFFDISAEELRPHFQEACRCFMRELESVMPFPLVKSAAAEDSMLALIRIARSFPPPPEELHGNGVILPPRHPNDGVLLAVS